MAQVSKASVGGSIIVVSEVTTGDHSKGADGRERPRFGAAKCVFAVTIANDLPLRATRQMNMSRERISWAPIALPIAVRPARIVVPIASVVFRFGVLPIVPWTAAERPHVGIITTARVNFGLAPVAIAMAAIRASATRANRLAAMPLVGTQVVVARVAIEHGYCVELGPFHPSTERFSC